MYSTTTYLNELSHILSRALLDKTNLKPGSEIKSHLKMFVLNGMGGSGKTQLALWCCRNASEKGFMATFWINASSPATVLQSYRSILNIIHSRNGIASNDSEATSLVRNIIQNWTKPWLIVFDNYDSPTAFKSQSIREYIPSGHGHILFTSRHEDSSRLGRYITLSRMTEEESVELLLLRPASTPQERSNAVEVASTLGFLALALDQAGAYIRSRDIPLDQFVVHYKTQ